MTKQERLSAFADMWTSDIDRYALVELDPNHPNACAIKDLQTGGLVVIDDDDDILEAVVTQMRKAGVQVLTAQEATPK